MLIPPEWLEDDTPYTIDDLDMILNKIRSRCYYVGGKIKYLNIPVSFDIETSSFRNADNEKCAIMYIWMLGIFGFCVCGRTWDEYMIAYHKICSFFRTCGNKRHILCYIHVASFDFQFLRKHHDFIKVFATDTHMPLYAITNEGFEFRCSYRLSGLSLDKVAKNLKFHTINKMVGDLDYRLIRHSQTPLSPEEMRYCVHDVKVVNAYIAECISDENEDITQIPLTNTGYVRRECRNRCFATPNYHELMKQLVLTPEEYFLCADAFMGGYVHSNPRNTHVTLYDVMPFDIKSSYPTRMIAEKYPMSEPKHASINTWSDFKYYLANYCCVFNITIKNIKPRYHYDYYLSASKCKIIGKRQLSNGRVVWADELTVSITNVDFDIIEYMYQIIPTNCSIHEFIYFEMDYLPTPIVKCVVDFFKQKTELDGIPDKKAEYNRAKRMVNSMYGMCATKPIKPVITYTDHEWGKKDYSKRHEIAPEIIKAINDYNNSYSRFLYYPWAVFITAYSRHAIWEAIIESGDDHVYTDTDSEKCLHFSAHAEFYAQYNERIQKRLEIACKVHGIPKEHIRPRTPAGDEKRLGVFEIDGEMCSMFKTNGAKRYIYIQDKQLHVVASGVSPNLMCEYMQKTYSNNERLFNAFDECLCIPSEYSGRLIHTYIDDMREGDIVDYLGNPFHFKELSSVHLEASDYNFSEMGEFLRYITTLTFDDEV